MTGRYLGLDNLAPDDDVPRTLLETPWSFDDDCAFYSPFRIDNWEICSVLIQQPNGRPYDDFPSTTWGTLIVSERVVMLLEQMFEDQIQFLPLHCCDEAGIDLEIRYYIAVILNTVDCLDYRRSIRYFGSSWSPRNRVLDPDHIPAGPMMFRTKGMHSFVVVDEATQTILRENKFQGVRFWEICLSTDENSPPEVEVPEEVIEKYRGQWERLPRFSGFSQ